MKKTKFKQNLSRTIKEIGNGSKIRGITLISLIVTVVVLLILAGVVIVTVTGNNGILSKSKFARDTYQNSANRENNALRDYENKIDKTALDIASSRENNTSDEITDFQIEVTEKNATSITVKVSRIESSVSILGYITLLNGKAIDFTKENEYSYTGLTKNTDYNIELIAVDENAKLKNSNKLTGKTESRLLYLYNRGNEYPPVTGGWQLTKDSNSGSDITSYNYMLMYSAEVGCRGSALSTKKVVNLTGYSKLKMLVNQEKVGTYNYFRIGVKNTPITGVAYNAFSSSDTSKVYNNNENNITLELDITNLSGNYYIGADCDTTRVEIHSIWLE